MTKFGKSFGMWAGALALTLVGAAAQAQTAAEWDQVVAAAKKEGKVVVYSGAAPNSFKRAVELFEKAYGIPVEILIGRGAEIRERVRTERSFNRNIGDVLINGLSTAIGQTMAGDVQDHGPLPNVAKLVPPFTDAPFNHTDKIMPTNPTSWAIAVNTNLVKPADEPKSWQDLLDPKWKGKIIYDNPLSNGGGQATMAIFLEKFGREWVEKFKAQQVTFSDQYTIAHQRLARGEFAIYAPFIVSETFNLKGLPIKGIVPTEGKTYSSQMVGMLTGAPHPNAAKLFVNYMLGDEVQTNFADLGYTSVTGKVSTTLPEELKPLMHGKLFDIMTEDRLQKAIPILEQIFK